MPVPAIPILPGGPFQGAPATVSTTIAIRPEPGAPCHKVTKITGYKDGGFALLAPYHSAKSGTLTKTLVDYRKRRFETNLEAMESFSATDRVKLSYHPDGFVQFSGENPRRIVSGRDPLTGEPKGLGIITNPMQSPVLTGPSFGVALWGLNDFDVQKGKSRGELIVFDQDDFVYEDCDESSWGSYGISFFIFTLYFQPYVRAICPRSFVMPLWLNQYQDGGRPFNLKVVRLGQQPFFLGAICFRRPGPKTEAASGWSIGSPGALAAGPIKPVLHAHYPADDWPESANSLDFGRWSPVKEDEPAAPSFGKDYSRLLERHEAELATRAARDLPELSFLRDASALLAEVIDGQLLLPQDLEDDPARVGVSTLALLGLRASRAIYLLLAAGYVSEARALVARLLATLHAASVLRDNPTSSAQRFIDGAGLADLAPDAWLQIVGSVDVSVADVAGMSLVEAPGGPRPGLGIAGQREPGRAKPLALVSASMVADLALLAHTIVRNDSSSRSLGVRLRGLKKAVTDTLERQPNDEQRGPRP
jgi:hypothetical protein